MTQEEKELLVKDLCARSLYEVKCLCDSGDRPLTIAYINRGKVHIEEYPQPTYDIDAVKHYLRPMSSMTEEERIVFESLGWRVDELNSNAPWNHNSYNVFDGIDWLNAHHFDYRGLIQMGLALEASEDMYKIN